MTKKKSNLLNEQNSSFPNILVPLSMPAYFSLEKEKEWKGNKWGKRLAVDFLFNLISFILVEKLKTHFKKK